MIYFTVKGQPMGKARPKATRQNGFIRLYSPTRTTNYETYVAREFQATGAKMLDGNVAIDIIAHYQTPCSWSKAKKQMAEQMKLRPTIKPDLDNIAKIILDGLNGVAYDDDKQVVELNLRKYYSQNPRVEIFIKNI